MIISTCMRGLLQHAVEIVQSLLSEESVSKVTYSTGGSHKGCKWAGGWLRTGDSGWIDQQGQLWIAGRLKDVIRSGSESVAAAEIERVLPCPFLRSSLGVHPILHLLRTVKIDCSTSRSP